MKNNSNNTYKLILIGGNRLNEDGPITKIYNLAKINKIKTLLIVDNDHYNKLCKKKKLKFVLKDLNINYQVWKNLNIKKIQKISNSNTIVLLLNCTWKIKADFILNFKNRIFNYHAASLPELRGAANITWKILMKDQSKFNINIHHVTENYDDGRIILDSKFKLISNSIKSPHEYLKIIQKKEIFIFRKFIKFISSNKFPKGKIQDDKKSFYWPRLNSSKDAKINWAWSTEDVILFIKAFSYPFDGAYSKLYNYKIIIYDGVITNEKFKFHPYQNGLIYRIDKKFIFIVCGSKAIKVKKEDMVLPRNIEKINLLGKRLC